MPRVFMRDDRVRLNERGRKNTGNMRDPMRIGAYVGESRDGQCDRVQWPGTTKPQSIVKGYIEKIGEQMELGLEGEEQ